MKQHTGANRPSASVIWATATLFVTIVSCCSLIGVSIMPLISGPSYKVFITLFTGLAVGSLVGSAIFSLIPQAFNLHLHDDHSYLWKALVIFFGIYLFYCSERIMRIYFEKRTRRKDKKRRNEEIARLSDNGGDHTQQFNGGSMRDIEVGTSAQNTNSKPLLSSQQLRHINKQQDSDGNTANKTTIEQDGGDQLAMVTLNEKHQENNLNKGNNFNANNLQVDIIKQCDNGDCDGAVVRLDAHTHVGHLHAQFDPHEILETMKANNKAPKKEIAPVAWMIIIGDGLHNFIDGLSIGAAFSESIYFGISTSVAVICEEFPHELGDFAVLISSGMSVKQALGFNFLSACTCYIGMVFGILLGDMTQSASYIFALAGGMFLYISLVDMMGELSATLDEPNQSTRETMKLLLMQNIGILTGIIIIFSLSWIDV